MKVYELTTEQRSELKQNFLFEVLCAPSYEDCVDADDIISDVLLDLYYENFDFTNDDFFCTAN